MSASKIAIYAADSQDVSVQNLLKRVSNSQRSITLITGTVSDLPQCLQGCDALVLLIQAADLAQVTRLTQEFVEAATQAGVGKLLWVAPACSEVSDLGKRLSEAETCVRTASLKTLVLRHAPLFSELLHQKKELKFRRILSLPLGSSALPWLAPEAIAEVCDAYLLGEKTTALPQVLTGVALTGQEMAIALSEALRQTVNSRIFAQRRFAAIDLDQSEQIDRDELFPYLLQLGYSKEEAQTILETADTDQNGAIDFEEFLRGLENHLDKILAEVPTEVQYVNVSRSAYLYDLMADGMDEAAAKSWLELLETLIEQGLPEQSEALTDYLGHPTPTLTDWASHYALDWVNVHILPGRGILTINEGLFEGRPAWITRLLQANDRLLISQRTLDFKTVVMQWGDINPITTEVVRYQPQVGEERVLQLQDGQLVGLSVRGSWQGLRSATQLFFNGQPLPRWQVALFRELGELQMEEVITLGAPEDVVCNCTQTTCGKVQALIDEGSTTLEQLADCTQATMICGGCKPLIEEMLGSASLSVGELVKKEHLGAGMTRFQFRPINGPVTPSKPGQHLLVQGRINNRWMTRAYTLSSRADQTEVYEITVKREELGEFSRWLCDHADSESLFRISEPRGEYYLDDTPTSIIFFAGGIGITPAIAMMRTLASNGDIRPFHLDWSAPHPEQFVFKSELEDLLALHPNLTMTLRATRVQGKLQAEDVQRLYPPQVGKVAFMCGPEAYMEAIHDYLQSSGWAMPDIRQELFSSKLDDDGKAHALPSLQPAIQVAGGVIPIEQDSFDVEPIGAMMAEAEAFLKQCYAERGLMSVFSERFTEVRQAIEQTGTYEQTFDELAYGAKLAWRNSNRCIGRNFWQNLNIRDMRHLETEAEMFQSILEHIKFATNKGDLRATITIFKPDGRRIWSSQYFRYAGYRQPDGSILGDPGNVEFTEQAMQLGWRGAGTRFDYLPIILQLPGREPQWFEIPPELILEVPFSHPRYDWFEELNLKWYALPAVCNMAFDVGGIQYTAAPFNGFYMSTELGSQNFSSPDRYNMLPTIAERMGLDCSQSWTLWKDLAMVEMNVAVLYSYKKQGVRMLDHHTLTDSLMRFADSEQRAGRSFYADWGWVVPPMSASLTPTWKTKMTNRILKPNYFYQPDPWTTSTQSGCPFHETASNSSGCPMH